MEKQVKSKKRVADHGEVFTAEREVNAMLDLVKHETERIVVQAVQANQTRARDSPDGLFRWVLEQFLFHNLP